MKSASITTREYNAFQKAYDFLNKELFDSSLPHVLVTLQRHAKTLGYFSPDRFTGRTEAHSAHEVALNPDGFADQPDEEILSTLAHEMVHVWQQTHGKVPTRGYHDKQWAAKMKEVGLHPSHTGKPGGKETGQRMDHYIVPEGKYSRAYTRLAAGGFRLNWQSQPQSKKQKAKGESKTRYSCLNCGLNAWAKPNVILLCGECFSKGAKPEEFLMRSALLG